MGSLGIHMCINNNDNSSNNNDKTALNNRIRIMKLQPWLDGSTKSQALLALHKMGIK